MTDKKEHQLPWWTWVVPFVVFLLGAWLSESLSMLSPAEIGYLPVILGLALVHWWGVRVLPGLFLVAFGFSYFWLDLPLGSSLLLTLPDLATVAASGRWFRISGAGDVWLPDARSMVAYLLAGLGLPIAVGIALCVWIAGSLGLISIVDQWATLIYFWMVLMLVAVAVSLPLLLFLTRQLSARGWLGGGEAIAATRLLDNREALLPRPLLLLLLLLALGMASVVLTPMQLAMVFGATLLAIALYLEPGTSVLSVSWVILLGFALGKLSPADTIAVDARLANAQAALLVFSIFGLLMSRSLADMRHELHQRRTAENAYLASEQRLRGILRAAPLGVGVARAGRLVWVSDSMADMFGYGRDEVIGRKVRSFLLDRQGYRSLSHDFSRQAVSGGTASAEVLLERKSGIPVWADIRASALDDADPRAGLVFTVLDIAERKHDQQARERLQRELAQTQKMEAVGSLTGGIAHEFNNILASVLGYSELARDRFASECPEKVGVYLGQVISAGHRARDLVAQMLRFSRGSAGSPEPLELVPLVKEVSKMLRNTLPSSIRIDVDASPDQTKVIAEPLQVHQVLVNLAVNARDAMSGSGVLTVSVYREREFRGECSACHKEICGDYQIISVADTGPGITLENQARIFDPFFSTREVGDGSGLGLSVTHTLLHQQDAHVVVQSAVGEGAAFLLCFPVVSNTEAAQERGVAGGLAQGRGQVLVVEDDVLLSEYFRELLSIAGYDVEMAASGEAALEVLGRDSSGIDLLITDQTMPGMTGLELIARVRERYAALPIMLCTGYAQGLDEAVVVAAGADSLLYKPLDSAKLLKEMGKLLRA